MCPSKAGAIEYSIHGRDAESALVELPEPGQPDVSDQTRARTHELEIKLQEREQEIVEMREYDALTGVPLRILFMQCVALELTRARRNGNTVGVMCFELRNYSQVVSAVGHAKSETLFVAFRRTSAERISLQRPCLPAYIRA